MLQKYRNAKLRRWMMGRESVLIVQLEVCLTTFLTVSDAAAKVTQYAQLIACHLLLPYNAGKVVENHFLKEIINVKCVPRALCMTMPVDVHHAEIEIKKHVL
jgi:hypothetical protein